MGNWGFTFDLAGWGWGRASGRRASTGVWPSRGGPAPATLQQPAGGAWWRSVSGSGGRQPVASSERRCWGAVLVGRLGETRRRGEGVGVEVARPCDD